jgi:hypothetical protein
MRAPGCCGLAPGGIAWKSALLGRASRCPRRLGLREGQPTIADQQGFQDADHTTAPPRREACGCGLPSIADHASRNGATTATPRRARSCAGASRRNRRTPRALRLQGGHHMATGRRLVRGQRVSADEPRPWIRSLGTQAGSNSRSGRHGCRDGAVVRIGLESPVAM